MAKKKEETPEAAAEVSKTAEEIYNEHNHATAQAGDAKMQCQCDACKEYRGE